MKISSLSKNGGLQALGILLVLVALAVVCCWFVGVLHVILFIGAVLLFFALLILLGGFVMSTGVIKPGIHAESDRINAPVITLSENTRNNEFDQIEGKIVRLLSEPDNSNNDIMKRFMCLVKAIDPTDPFPDYLVNGISKKMLYEYKRKYGTLLLNREHPPAVLLTVEETMRTLNSEERAGFASFCMEKRV